MRDNLRRRRRPEAAQARDKVILDAAQRTFASKGFAAASISEISAAAGVAVGTIYCRYDSKEALLGAVLTRCAERFLAGFVAGSDMPWRSRLDHLFRSLMEEAAAQPDLPALMRLAHHLPEDPGRQLIQAAIARFISDGQAAGAFRDVDVGQAAAIGYGMVQGAMVELLQQRASPAALADLLADACWRWMRR